MIIKTYYMGVHSHFSPSRLLMIIKTYYLGVHSHFCTITVVYDQQNLLFGGPFTLLYHHGCLWSSKLTIWGFIHIFVTSRLFMIIKTYYLGFIYILYHHGCLWSLKLTIWGFIYILYHHGCLWSLKLTIWGFIHIFVPSRSFMIIKTYYLGVHSHFCTITVVHDH